jgi:predicted dehydrogenase
MPAFARSKRSKLVAVISGDPEKRETLSEKYDLDLHGDYGDLEHVLREGAIDAVYIATPNTLHGTFAKRAAALGVNVLCEKPLATSVAECESIATACAQAHVKLMVGYRLHFEATTLKALELSSICGHVVRPGGIRDRPDLGGGALLDLGVYCVNAARNLFASEPELVLAASQYRGGVDDTTAALLQFPQGRTAQFTVSNDIAQVSSYRIAGTEGDLRKRGPRAPKESDSAAR